MLARVLCLIVLLLEARGCYISISERRWKIFAYYTQISNLVTVLSALLLVIIGQRNWVTSFRYLSTCMLVMTFLVTVCVLIPMGGDPQKLLWSGNGLYHHVLCPVISSVSYVFFEHHAGIHLIWVPAAVTLAYGLIMLYMNGTRRFDGPYPFFRVHNQTVKATLFWMIILLAVITGISTGVWAVARG